MHNDVHNDRQRFPKGRTDTAREVDPVQGRPGGSVQRQGKCFSGSTRSGDLNICMVILLGDGAVYLRQLFFLRRLAENESEFTMKCDRWVFIYSRL